MVNVKKYRRVRQPIALHALTAGYPQEDTLTAPRYRKTRGGQIYAIDKLLGDDRFVFLSVEGIPDWSLSRSEIFAFDAEGLVKHGAVVREYDAAWMPEFIHLQDLLEKDDIYVWDYGIEDINLLRKIVNRNPERKRVFEALKTAVDSRTLSGQEAIEFLRTPGRWTRKIDKVGGHVLTPEILVPKELVISGSIVEVGDVEPKIIPLTHTG